MSNHPEIVAYDRAIVAAEGANTRLLQTLYEMDVDPRLALEGAVGEGDRRIMGILIEALILREATTVTQPGRDLFTYFSRAFHVAFRMGENEKVTWLIADIDHHLERNQLAPRALNFIAHMIHVTHPVRAIHMLSMIDDPDQRKTVTQFMQAQHFLAPAELVRLSHVPPHVAIVFCKYPSVTMTWLLQNQKTRWGGLSKDLLYKIFSFVIQGEIQENQMLALHRTAKAALEKAKLNAPTPDEAKKLAAIQRRLVRAEKSVAGTKSARLKKTTDVYNRTDVLCEHRKLWWPLPDPLLPRSMKTMMKASPKYQNLSALRTWVGRCKEECECKLLNQAENKLIADKLQNILKRLSTLPEFDVKTCDPKILAQYLQTPDDNGETLESLLRPLPYWRELKKLFPLMMEALEDPRKESGMRHGCFC